MDGRDNALSLTEIAALAEVGISAASNWRKRHDSFPSPRRVDGHEAYSSDEVEEWLLTRTISKAGLKAGEPTGTTYGDRFRRNRRTAIEPDPANRAPRVRAADREHELWTAVERLRGAYHFASIVDYALGLLHINLHDHDRWASLVDSRDWAETRRLLTTTTLETPIGAHLPLFEVVTPTTAADLSLTNLIRVVDTVVSGNDAERLNIASALCDALLEKISRDFVRDNGHRTPTVLARCMVALLAPGPTDRVYDPICGSGELLAAAKEHCSSPREDEPLLFGQALDDRSWRTTTLNLALHGTRGVVRPQGLPFDDDAFPDERFDVVLMNPPFNSRRGLDRVDRFPYGTPPRHNANFAWLQHAVTKLAAGGKAAVLMPNNSTFSHGRDHLIRQAMIEAGVVDCVIALPSNTFPSTAVKTCLWVLRSPERRRDVDEVLLIHATGTKAAKKHRDQPLSNEEIEQIAREYHGWINMKNHGGHKGEAGFSRSVPHAEIQANDWALEPRMYVFDDDREPRSPAERSKALRAALNESHAQADAARAHLDARLALSAGDEPRSEWSTVPLGEVAEVMAGPATMTREGVDTSRTPLVLPRNIWFGRVDQGKLDEVATSTATRHRRYKLLPGDLVCARTGTLGRYGLVSGSELGWLVGPGCMRLRPDDQVHPVYLLHYLNSPGALEWLMENSNSSVIRYVSTDVLRRLPVRLPPMSVQEELAMTLITFDEQMSVHRRLADETERLRDLLLPTVGAELSEEDRRRVDQP